MGNTFDFRRRRRIKQPPAPPKRRAQRSFGLFMFLVITAGLILVANGQFTAQTSSLMITPIASSSAFPTTTRTSSPTPLAFGPILTKTPIATVEPTPTPTPTNTSKAIEKSAISISILNGSGTAGAANTLRAQLVKSGFTVRHIAVASAKRNTTMVYYQTGQKAAAELVASFISNHVLEFEENSTLANPDNVLIIVGKQ